eukprot:scaffold1110_cov182-Ochromonas_danica.AAC.12
MGWKDLSTLDIACVGKSVREDWLSSLTDLRKERNRVDSRMSDEQMRKFYLWLGRCVVFCVEEFPLRLTVLHDLMEELNLESYCPVLQSMSIETSRNSYNLSDGCHLESNLSLFLGHCQNLRKVTVRFNPSSDTRSKYLGESIFQVLEKTIRENSLVEFSSIAASCHSNVIARLLAKHATSLTDFYLIWSDEKTEPMVSILFDMQIHPKVLHVIYAKQIPSQMILSIMTNLASAGKSLDTLQIWSTNGTSSNSLDGDDFLVSVATSCPKLTRLTTSNPCSGENLCLCYDLCPHLQCVSIIGTIVVDEMKRLVSIVVKDSIEDWVVCLSHVLRRRQYKQVTLRLSRAVNYHPVGNQKSMLEPYQIGVDTSASEASLIAMLQDLPHLNNLDFEIDRSYTDAALIAITEHAKSLTEMVVTVDNSTLHNFHYADKLSSKIIEACQMLKRLWGCWCGLESLLAASRHVSLKEVYLSIHHSVSAESLDNIMAQDKVKWSSTLEKGEVVVIQSRCGWKFNKKYHHWTKDGGN